MTTAAATEDNRIWIACIPKRRGVPKPLSAVAIERCRKCDSRIWMAPSSIEILLCRPDLAHPVCIPCWVQHMKDNPHEWEKFRVHTTKTQGQEVFAHTGITVEQAIEQIFGVTAEMLDLKGSS